MNRHLLRLFALNGFVAVVLGAFGAHALEASVSPDRLAIWQTAVHYQMFHSLGLLACAWLEAVLGRITLLRWSARLFLVGLLLFCGSLYLLVLADAAWLGAVTPLGGVAWLAAWLLLAAVARRLPLHN
ncbi:MAG: DUF423 domain-containing protein [Pseudohongiellaceae bacterium]